MKKNNGISLLEIIMIIVIIGVLAVIVIPKVTDISGSAEKRTEEYIIRTIQDSLATYKAVNK